MDRRFTSSVLVVIGALVLHGCALFTPGLDAIKQGDASTIRSFLDKGGNPNAVERDALSGEEMPLLAHALGLARYDIAELLIQRGANPDLAAKPFFLHTERFHTLTDLSVEMLLAAGMNPTLQITEKGTQPIHYACGGKSSFNLLLQKGASIPDPKNSSQTKEIADGQSVLARCIKHYSDIDRMLTSIKSDGSNHFVRDLYTDQQTTARNSIVFLLNYGVDPNANLTFNDGTRLPIILYAYRYAPDIARLLLDRGADLFATRTPGNLTVLHTAARFANANDVRDLLDRARSTIQRQTRSAPEAEKRFTAWVNQTFSQIESSEKGATALHRAATEEKLDVLRVLIEYGADPSLKNNQGQTAQNILTAKKQDREETQQLLAAAERRRAEEAAEAKRQSAQNTQLALGILGSVALAKGMSGPNYSDAQRSEVIGAFVTDRVNAMNGSETHNLEQASTKAQDELDLNLLAKQTQQNKSSGNLAAPPISTVTAAPTPAADYDALYAPPGQEITYSCAGYAPVKETITSDAQCTAAVIAWKNISCRADWLTHRATEAMYECGVRYSRGAPRAANQDRLDGTRKMIQQYGYAK